MNEDDARALEGIRSEMLALARIIGAPESLLPMSSEPELEGQWLHAEADPSGASFGYVYRGREGTRLIERSRNARVVLETIFRWVTFVMASTQEAEHRIAGEDSRRQLFAIQESLLARLDPDWASRIRETNASVLATHPFEDKQRFHSAAKQTSAGALDR